jgi:hypothetical protein
MPGPRDAALDRAPGRDTALLADALRALQGHLEGPVPEDDVTAAHVEDLVAQALAEIHRVQGSTPVQGGIAPVLGAGVLQELLRARRVPAPPDGPPTVDATR